MRVDDAIELEILVLLLCNERILQRTPPMSGASRLHTAVRLENRPKERDARGNDVRTRRLDDQIAGRIENCHVLAATTSGRRLHTRPTAKLTLGADLSAPTTASRTGNSRLECTWRRRCRTSSRERKTLS